MSKNLGQIERENDFETRMDKFKSIIRKYENEEMRKIKQKSSDEIEFETSKIINEARQLDGEQFSKKLKSVQVEAKIRKSRKINELRLSKMKVRFEMIEKVQSDIKAALLNKISNKETYKQLLEGLLIQTMIKMLEENLEVKCLERDVDLVKDAIFAAETRFKEMCVQETKFQISKEYLPDSDLGGIIVTSLKGRIVCNNTLRARLDYALQLSLPDVRSMLFSSDY